MSYGQYKRASSRPAAQKVAPPLPLTPAQQAHAARMKDLWQEHFPDDPLLKELHALGMIDGYRNIISITPHEAKNGTA